MKKPTSIAIVLTAVALFLSVIVTASTPQPGKGKGGGGDTGAIYQKDCAKCHGADGKGIKSLEPPDFTDAKWQASNNDKKVATDIANGKGVMPAFKGKLTPVQINGLVKHIRGFSPKAAKPAK
jgi:cytochrome c oxidase cbb3-type subunit III